MTRAKSLILIFAIFYFTGCVTNSVSSSDIDKDGVSDYRDVCKNTPFGAKVNRHGCALDTDFDGVIDLYDQCSGTTASQLVDEAGCTIREL